MATALLSTRGQVVIPADIRRSVGFQAGDQLRVTVSDDGKEVHLRRQETLDEMADRLSHYIKPGTEPLMDVRGFYDQREPRV